jgi:hypothetical protein
MAQDRMYLACTHPECDGARFKLYLARQGDGGTAWDAMASREDVRDFFEAHEECGVYPERPFRIKYEGE